jgi:dTDP-4-dehydrorhamnose 3,5-epimerase
MIVEELELPGVLLIKPKRYVDERGYFEELYKQAFFKAANLRTDFVQDNLSHSAKGVVRGMHYQVAPHAQAKLVRVLKGKVIDVVVDVRPASPTFGHYLQVELSEQNAHQLLVPEGYAHGFEALEDTLFMYKCSAEYHKEAEGGFRYDDPTVSIPWQTVTPLVSDKDLQLPLLADISPSLLVF